MHTTYISSNQATEISYLFAAWSTRSWLYFVKRQFLRRMAAHSLAFLVPKETIYFPLGPRRRHILLLLTGVNVSAFPFVTFLSVGYRLEWCFARAGSRICTTPESILCLTQTRGLHLLFCFTLLNDHRYVSPLDVLTQVLYRRVHGASFLCSRVMPEASNGRISFIKFLIWSLGSSKIQLYPL